MEFSRRHPAGNAADDEGYECRRRGHGSPGAPAAHDSAEYQAIWDRLVNRRAVPRADGFRLSAPGSDPGGIVGMVGQPCLDGLSAVRWQLAVDIDVQFVFGDGCVAIDHGLTLRVT